MVMTNWTIMVIQDYSIYGLMHQAQIASHQAVLNDNHFEVVGYSQREEWYWSWPFWWRRTVYTLQYRVFPVFLDEPVFRSTIDVGSGESVSFLGGNAMIELKSTMGSGVTPQVTVESQTLSGNPAPIEGNPKWEITENDDGNGGECFSLELSNDDKTAKVIKKAAGSGKFKVTGDGDLSTGEKLFFEEYLLTISPDDADVFKSTVADVAE